MENGALGALSVSRQLIGKDRESATADHVRDPLIRGHAAEESRHDRDVRWRRAIRPSVAGVGGVDRRGSERWMRNRD